MVLFLKFKTVFLIFVMLTETIGVDYCKIESCEEEKQHTLCKYPNNTVACKVNGVKAVTIALRKAILDRHNVHRQTVALGKQSPQPPASNMMQLTWHEEAANIAQHWANQCVFKHDNCRNLKNSLVGQNIASYGSNSKSSSFKEIIVGMVDLWFAEVKDFDKAGVDKFAPWNGVKDTGHYSQLVWAETTGVGCGLIQIASEDDKEFITTHLVCNYVPAGNFIGQPIYKKGKACSECPGKCSQTYPGLCI